MSFISIMVSSALALTPAAGDDGGERIVSQVYGAAAREGWVASCRSVSHDQLLDAYRRQQAGSDLSFKAAMAYGSCLIEAGNERSATHFLTDVLDGDGVRESSQRNALKSNLAIAFMRLRDIDAAEAILEDILENGFDAANASRLAMIAQLRAVDPATPETERVGYFERVLALIDQALSSVDSRSPAYAPYLIQAGVVGTSHALSVSGEGEADLSLAQSRLDEAIALLEARPGRSARDDALLMDAYVNKASLHRLAGNANAAEVAAERAIEAAPSSRLRLLAQEMTSPSDRSNDGRTSVRRFVPGEYVHLEDH